MKNYLLVLFVSSGLCCNTHAQSSEEIIYAFAKDTIANGGVIFNPEKNDLKPVCVIWIHGWGVNFYSPTYVKIGRQLAARGYTCIDGNTRMHDLGTVEGYKGDKRIRGGGYWGLAGEEMRDIAAWIDVAVKHGFKHVILVGHSAGWAAVRSYQAGTQDPRVIGVVLASGAVRAESRPTDTAQLVQAVRMLSEGKPDELIQDPKRSFPSYVSAGTFMDILNTPAEYKDFFGTLKETVKPGITRIHCPILAWFGTDGDVGNASELELLKSSIKRLNSGPLSVTTTLIKNADHMYSGQEAQVAEILAGWIATVGKD